MAVLRHFKDASTEHGRGTVAHSAVALRLAVLGLAAAALVPALCASAQTASSSCESDLTPHFSVPAGLKRVGIIVIGIKDYYLTSGGIDEYNDSLTTAGSRTLLAALTAKLKDVGYESTLARHEDIDSTARSDVFPLYGAVENEVLTHVLGGGLKFDSRVKHFDYSIGPVAGMCEKLGVDALLLVRAWDEERTARRRQMIAGATAGAVAGAVVSALVGFGGSVVVPRADQSYVSAALVDSTGALRWFGRTRRTEAQGFTDEKAARNMVENLFASWPVERDKRADHL